MQPKTFIKIFGEIKNNKHGSNSYSEAFMDDPTVHVHYTVKNR